MATWIEWSALTAAPLWGAGTASLLWPVLLGQAKKLSRKQKSRLFTAFLSLLAIAVCLVLFAVWMSRAMRKYMRNDKASATPLPDSDLWQLQPRSTDKDDLPDDSSADAP